MAMWAVQEVLNNVESDKRKRMKEEGRSESEIKEAVDEMYAEVAKDTFTMGVKLLWKVFGG